MPEHTIDELLHDLRRYTESRALLMDAIEHDPSGKDNPLYESCINTCSIVEGRILRAQNEIRELVRMRGRFDK